MSAITGIVKYQGVIDLKAAKTYVVLALVFFLAIAYGYLLPKFASGILFVYTKSSYVWMLTTSSIFVTVIAGLVGLLVGAFIGSDVIAQEFESGTIIKLFSLPIRRRDIYLGKFIEKFLFSLVLSLIFVLVAIICGYTFSGNQGYFQWLLPFTMGIVLLIIGFSSLGFLFGPLVRQSSFVFGIIFGISLFFMVIYGIIVSKVGYSYGTFAIPFMNMSLLPGSIMNYAINPSGIFHFVYTSFGNSRAYNISTWEYMILNVVFASIEILFILGLGFVLFGKAELRS